MSKKENQLTISDKIHNLRRCYKSLREQNKAGANVTWGSIVPPLFIPVSKSGHLKVLQAAIIGEKNPAHLYTRIVNQLIS